MDASAPPCYTADMTIGDTQFTVEVAFSTSAKETPYNKIKRLILEDVHFASHQVSKDTIGN